MRATIFQLATTWFPAFEGTDEDGKTPPADPPKNPPADPPKDGTFTQDEVNSILKKEKEKYREQMQSTVSELEMLRKKANLTKEEKAQLDTKIEDLQNQLLTKEQKAQTELERYRKNAEKEKTTLTEELATWKARYSKSTIERSIMDAGLKHDAVDPEQLVKLLSHDTQIVEELNEDGEPTGNLVPKVTFKDTDKDGKPIELKLTPEETVKRMSEIDRYFNLFKNKGSGGMGDLSRRNKGEPSIADLAKSNPNEYVEKRMKGELSLDQ